MNIPNIIIQTSIKKPEQYIIDKILAKCQGWEYIHFNDSEIIEFFKNNYVEEFKDIINKFNSIFHGAHKGDIFRYYYLYIKGGVYIDSDAMIETDINEIIQDYSFFTVNSGISNSIFQGFIGATPKHDIIYKALKDVYNINIKYLYFHYGILCSNLFQIINSENFINIKLYNESFNETDSQNGICKTINDSNEIILIHYWKYKIIPL